ncbi:ANK3, partial [Symbiodinium microadriaticum]
MGAAALARWRCERTTWDNWDNGLVSLIILGRPWGMSRRRLAAVPPNPVPLQINLADPLYRPTMRIRVTRQDVDRLSHDDVIVMPEFFGRANDWDAYYTLLREVREGQANGIDQTKWESWHEGAHLLTKNPSCSRAFNDVLDRICDHFSIANGHLRHSASREVLGMRFNWYRDGSDWKPFHHDAAAFNPRMAEKQNCTVGVSFGSSRELAFRNTATADLVYFPQSNGMLFFFGRDVNIRWQHGLNALPLEQQSGKGRISIILWGLCQLAIEEMGSPPMLPPRDDGKGKGKGKTKDARREPGRNLQMGQRRFSSRWKIAAQLLQGSEEEDLLDLVQCNAVIAAIVAALRLLDLERGLGLQAQESAGAFADSVGSLGKFIVDAVALNSVISSAGSSFNSCCGETEGIVAWQCHAKSDIDLQASQYKVAVAATIACAPTANIKQYDVSMLRRALVLCDLSSPLRRSPSAGGVGVQLDIIGHPGKIMASRGKGGRAGDKILPDDALWEDVGRPEAIHIIFGQLVNSFSKELLKASSSGDAEVVLNVLQQLQDPNCCNLQGDSALLQAARRGHSGVVEMLCQAKAALDTEDMQGKMPLTVAAQCNHLEVLRLLLGARANSNLKDHEGMTPLQWATQHCHLQAMQLLLDGGADKDLANDRRETPLCVAA